MFCNKCTLQFDKKYVFDLHLKLVHGEKIETKSEPFKEPENLDHLLNKSELIKSEVKTEVKEEPFENFEAREQDGIDFITSADFDHSFNESEFPTQKTDCAIKHKIREEPNESNVPLKKFKQDCNQSNHHAKSKTIEKKTDLEMASVKDNTSGILDLNKDFSTVLKCSICLEVFGKRNDLKKHIIKVHVNSIKCHYCSEKFANHKNMYAHELSVHAIKCQVGPGNFITNKEKDKQWNVFLLKCARTDT